MVIKNLHFFDNNGYNLNFNWVVDRIVKGEEIGHWEGSIYLPKVSVGLYANTSIYILEKISPSEFTHTNEYFDEINKIDTSKYNNEYFFPTGTSKIKFTWDPLNTFVDEFFMFNFDESYISKETSSLIYTPNDGPDCNELLVNTFDVYEIPLDNNINSKALPIHIAFMADEKYDATTYNRTLIMSYDGEIIARIKFYAETVEEDERLKIWNSNLGYNITPEDEMLFYKSDIKEYKTNYILLNEKRKELMMEGSNIYPYIGSYKAIINAIKFFGYNNLNIIEYWRNVNEKDNEKFGKIYHSSKYSLTNKETLRIGTRNIVLPNKDYKKTNSLALIYSINKPLEKTDEMDLPLVKEYFTYTLEEALIKLFGLRKKLNKEFMPGSGKIIDIIGEANYFGLYGITKIHDQSSIIKTDSKYNININFDVENKYVHITENSEDNNISAKVILKNTSFEDVTFENCELKFNCINNQYSLSNFEDPLGLHSNVDNVFKLNNEDISFDNIDKLNKPDNITWKIKMSDDQFDEDLRNANIIKYYTKKDLEGYTFTDNKYYNGITVELPYIGYYDVIMELGFTGDERKLTKTKKRCIKVEPYQIELIGFYYDARDLPKSLQYIMDDKLKKFIDDNIKSMHKSAYDERMEETDPDFSMYINESKPGPYYNGNIHTDWSVLDNVSFEISKLIPNVEYTRYIRNGVDVKPYTWFLLGYNYTKIAGKINPKWTITNNTTKEEKTYEGEYFTFLLKNEGNYTIKLTLEDKNSNSYEISRNIVVVSKTANYKLYQTFKKEYDHMIYQDELNILNEYYLDDKQDTE